MISLSLHLVSCVGGLGEPQSRSQRLIFGESTVDRRFSGGFRSQPVYMVARLFFVVVTVYVALVYYVQGVRRCRDTSTLKMSAPGGTGSVVTLISFSRYPIH
jgi:hypothetical protein